MARGAIMVSVRRIQRNCSVCTGRHSRRVWVGSAFLVAPSSETAARVAAILAPSLIEAVTVLALRSFAGIYWTTQRPCAMSVEGKMLILDALYFCLAVLVCAQNSAGRYWWPVFQYNRNE